MNLPPLPEFGTLFEYKSRSKNPFLYFTKEQMLAYGQACRDAVIAEIQAKIESMRNAQN